METNADLQSLWRGRKTVGGAGASVWQMSPSYGGKLWDGADVGCVCGAGGRGMSGGPRGDCKSAGEASCEDTVIFLVVTLGQNGG